jgi:hypothetical protein
MKNFSVWFVSDWYEPLLLRMVIQYEHACVYYFKYCVSTFKEVVPVWTFEFISNKFNVYITEFFLP